MQEDEVYDIIHPFVDVSLVGLIFVVLDVGDSGQVLLLGIAYESFQQEVILWLSLSISHSEFIMCAMRSRKLRMKIQ